MDTPKTLQQAVVFFSDRDRAFQYALNFRFPNGKVACPRCGSEKHSFIKTRRIWFCYGCNKQFSLKVGTIFEDSPIGLDKWMMAMWMIAACKNGISSYEIHRSIGVTQKTAWFMLHRIRKSMHSESITKLGGDGEVEADETFIGGKSRNMHLSKRQRRITGRGPTDKVAVMGILERGGEVRLAVIPNRRKKAVQAEVRKHVQTGTALYTDFLLSYQGLGSDYIHKVVDHAVEYVNGRIHTNGLENFWSLLKRGINGTYVSIEPFHLFRYLDEQAFRYNNRKNMNDQARFEKVLGNIAGRRLTYNELTGLGAATSH